MPAVHIAPEGKVAFVSGSNRGVGKAITTELLEHGAQKVYAGARNVDSLSELTAIYQDRLVPTRLDVTDDISIATAAENAGDVEIVINNAGVFVTGGVLSSDTLETLRKNHEVYVLGVLKVTNAFIDALRKKPTAASVNMSSVAGLGNMPMAATYSVTKAAVHSITQGMRGELANDNIVVVGVYPGPIDTDMGKNIDMDKESPENVAKDVVQGLIEGKEDIFPDAMSKSIGQAYMSDPKTVETQFSQYESQTSTTQ